MEKPLFEHDCDRCVFLGQHEGHDLYYCKAEGPRATVIARYGNEGSHYMSGLQFGIDGTIPELAEALKRAKVKGLHPAN